MNKKGLFDGWKWGKVSDIIDFNPKYTIKKGVKVKYIEMAAVPEHSREIEYFQSREFKSGSKFKNGETLFSRITPCLQNGKTSKVSKLKENEIANGSTEFIVLSPKDKRDEDFIYYLSLDNSFRKYAEKRMIGSTGRQRVSWQSLSEYKLLIPPLKNRIKIAEILSSLDDKIELNNQMNKNLENMAQTIFKHWFVDFEFPDENGKPYASNGGKFVKSEMGLIPEGWRVGRINDVAEVIGGGTPSRKVDEYFTEKGIPWITPKDLSSYNKKFIERGSQDISSLGLKKSSAKLMPKDTVLFSSRAPIGYIVISKNEVSTNQGFKSLIPKNGFGVEYIYYLIKYIRPLIENRASGSTFKEISGGEMKKISVIIPNEKILKKFESILNSSSSQMLSNEEEVENLIQIRDSLLPKLMSGEIRVGDMEK